MSATKRRIMDMDGEPLSQEGYNDLARRYLESRSELEKSQLDHSRLTEELDQLATTRSEPALPFEVITAVIKQADKHTLCKLARVSKEIGKHALRELYTYLDLTGCPWDTGVNFWHEASLQQFEASIVSGIGRGILAFVGRKNARIVAKTLEIDSASPILESLCRWANKSIKQRRAVLKHLSSVKTVKCVTNVNSERTDFRFAMEAIPAQVISKLKHFSISGFSLTWGSMSPFNHFPSGLTSLEVTSLGNASDARSLFSSTAPFTNNLSTLRISTDGHPEYALIDTSVVADILKFHALRHLHLQALDLSTELGQDGALCGVLAPTFTFPLLETLYLGLVVDPSTKEIICSELIEWIGGCRERLRWPCIQDVELAFLGSKTSSGWGFVTTTWVRLMVRITIVLGDSGYTVFQIDDDIVSGRKTKF